MRSVESLGVLRERDFRLVFAAEAVSLVGDGIVPVALAFAVLDLTHSATDLGLVLAAETLALIVFLLAGGVAADRVPRKRVMIAADLVRTVSQALVGILLVGGHAKLWQLTALQVPLGAASGFFYPAASGLMPLVAGVARVQQANALRAAAEAGGSIVGPVIAGVLVATVGAGQAILLDAATYAISAVLLSRVAVVQPLREGAPGRLVADLRAGAAEVLSRTWLWATIATFSTAVMLTAATMVLGPLVATRRLGGARAWATILAARGVGGVLGGIISLRIKPRRPLLVGILACEAGVIPVFLLASGASTLPIALAAVIGGAGVMIFNTLWETTVQRHVPAEALSRVSSYDWLGSLALYPVGLALAGPLADALGTDATLYLAGAAELAILSGLLLVRQVRTIGPGDPAPSPAQAAAPSI